MGPTGQGPMTGRGMGWCGGANAESDAAANPRGFGMGRGGGRGRGWRHRNGRQAIGWPGGQFASGFGAESPSALSREQTLAMLTQHAAGLARTLDELKARIEQFEKSEADAAPASKK
jgi:hypothetical protein